MTARRSFAIYAITRHGVKIAERLTAGLAGADLFVSEKMIDSAPAGARRLPLPMGPLLPKRSKPSMRTRHRVRWVFPRRLCRPRWKCFRQS